MAASRAAASRTRAASKLRGRRSVPGGGHAHSGGLEAPGRRRAARAWLAARALAAVAASARPGWRRLPPGDDPARAGGGVRGPHPSPGAAGRRRAPWAGACAERRGRPGRRWPPVPASSTPWCSARSPAAAGLAPAAAARLAVHGACSARRVGRAQAGCRSTWPTPSAVAACARRRRRRCAAAGGRRRLRRGPPVGPVAGAAGRTPRPLGGAALCLMTPTTTWQRTTPTVSDTPTAARAGPLRVGIGGPVGSGKTALVVALCRSLRPRPLGGGRDQRHLHRRRTPPSCGGPASSPDERIVAVETGCCPHTAIRDDIAANARRHRAAHRRPPRRGGRAGGVGRRQPHRHLQPALVDVQLFVIDVAGGDKVPRKGGPGITRSDLLVVNKTDLAPHVGADLGGHGARRRTGPPGPARPCSAPWSRIRSPPRSPLSWSPG